VGGLWGGQSASSPQGSNTRPVITAASTPRADPTFIVAMPRLRAAEAASGATALGGAVAERQTIETLAAKILEKMPTSRARLTETSTTGAPAIDPLPPANRLGERDGAAANDQGQSPGLRRRWMLL
jgi:hypothetical protein